MADADAPWCNGSPENVGGPLHALRQLTEVRSCDTVPPLPCNAVLS